MCAIIGSFDKATFQHLYTINEHRGNLSHSVVKFEVNATAPDDVDILELWKSPGNLNLQVVDRGVDGPYMIGHTQAPTTDTSNIHPSGYNGSLMWHNGIVKQKELQPDIWDTWWLLRGIEEEGFDFLSTVVGSFACVLYGVEKKIYVFRNEIAPLYIDENFNISSVEIEGFKSLRPNVAFEMNLSTKKLKEVAEFKTKENPYYFGEE